MDKYSLWEELVAKVARTVAVDFPETEEEDLAQDLMLYVLENSRLTDPDHEYAAKGLLDKAKELAWNYRKQALYITSQYAYRTSDVKKLLETLFQYEDWGDSYLPEDAKSLSDDDRWIMNTDLKYAYDHIGLTYQRYIFNRYVLGVNPEGENDRQKLARAIEKMADILNLYRPRREHSGPGARKAVSNKHSQEITRGQT